jgi:hypothetical protein
MTPTLEKKIKAPLRAVASGNMTPERSKELFEGIDSGETRRRLADEYQKIWQRED